MTPDSQCGECNGSGHIVATRDSIGRTLYKRCHCMSRASAINFGRLHEATAAANTPLLDYLTSNMDITDTEIVDKGYYTTFDQHLKRVMLDNISITIRDITDQELFDTWLGRSDILEEEGIGRDKQTVMDMVRSSDLVILRMGMMTYKMNGLAELVVDSMRSRARNAKPLWFVHGVDWNATFPSHSSDAVAILNSYTKLDLSHHRAAKAVPVSGTALVGASPRVTTTVLGDMRRKKK